MSIFAFGRALVPTQEEKTRCELVERIYLIIVSREGNNARFELLSNILILSMWWDVSPLQYAYGHAKKGMIYAWIVHRWIVSLMIVCRELAQPPVLVFCILRVVIIHKIFP